MGKLSEPALLAPVLSSPTRTALLPPQFLGLTNQWKIRHSVATHTDATTRRAPTGSSSQEDKTDIQAEKTDIQEEKTDIGKETTDIQEEETGIPEETNDI